MAHYAGKVNYQIQGMVEKNKVHKKSFLNCVQNSWYADSPTHPLLDVMFQDPVPPELIGLLQKADNPLLQQIFADKESDNSPTKGLSKVTVVSKFKVPL